MERLKSLLYSPATSVLIGLGAGVAYGLTTRAAFGLQELSAVFGTLSAGFLCLTPFALGALTVFFVPAHTPLVYMGDKAIVFYAVYPVDWRRRHGME